MHRSYFFSCQNIKKNSSQIQPCSNRITSRISVKNKTRAIFPKKRQERRPERNVVMMYFRFDSSLARETTIVLMPRSPSAERTRVSPPLGGRLPSMRTPSPHQRLAQRGAGQRTAINHRLQRARGPRNLTPPLPLPSLPRPITTITAVRHKLNSRAVCSRLPLLSPLPIPASICTGRALLRFSCIVELHVSFEGFNSY